MIRNAIGLLLLLCGTAWGRFGDPVHLTDDARDLDGDGKADRVVLEMPGGEFGHHEFTLSVNGARLEGRGEYLRGTFSIVDIDSTDLYLELAIPESGPSDDYAVHVFWYDGLAIREVGTVAGRQPRIDGSGVVRATRRGSVLHTWFYPADYRLTVEREFAFVPRDLYPMNAPVTLKRDLPLYGERTDAAPTDTVHVDESAVILASDDAAWCLLEYGDGCLGWFRVSGGRVCGTVIDQAFAGWSSTPWSGRRPVTLLVDLPLHQSSRRWEIIRWAKRGEAGTVARLGRENWLEFRQPGRRACLIPLDGEVVGGVSGWECFEGLCSAD